MDLGEIRKLAVIAIASDDLLVDKVVLKGGNALELIHKIGNRSSLDIDYSIDGDFDDVQDVEARIINSLQSRFATAGLVAFDIRFSKKPKKGAAAQGYLVEFKIIERGFWDKYQGDIEQVRRNAHISGPHQQRVFSIEMSKNEYCAGKELAVLSDYDIYVYSPKMIAVEKLRAICQQMPQYTPRRNPTPRPRDFYDIHQVITARAIILEQERDLFQRVFSAKSVPLRLLNDIRHHSAFHEGAWSSVQDSVSESLPPFRMFFDFVVEEVDRLHSFWDP